VLELATYSIEAEVIINACLLYKTQQLHFKQHYKRSMKLVIRVCIISQNEHSMAFPQILDFQTHICLKS